MSDDIDIRHGGLVSVDTESLREAARAAARVAERVAASADRVQWAAGLLTQSDAGMLDLRTRFQAAEAAYRVRGLGIELAEIGRALDSAAALYDVVELRVRWANAEPRDRDGLEALLRAALGDTEFGWLAGAPLFTIFGAPDLRELEWRTESTAALSDAIDGAAAGWLGAIGWFGSRVLFPASPTPDPGVLLGSAALAVQRGLLGAGDGVVRGPVRGAGQPVRVSVASRPVTAAPAGLAQALARLPGGEDGRVRVERYDRRDGGREWVVYIAGTQEGGSAEAFDFPSNLDLYGGDRSASYNAVVDALADAGRAPGEPLHVVGHSQGAMIGASLAAEDPGVRTVISAGTPTSAVVGADVLSVDLRHRDDPVAALSGQGTALGTGSPDSIVVSRTVPGTGQADLIGAHALDAYVETAAMVDASRDPRVDAVRDVWSGLVGATVTATVYDVERMPVAPRVAANPG